MLGIDVSKDNLVCTLLDPVTRQVRWEKTVPNTEAAVRKGLADAVTSLKQRVKVLPHAAGPLQQAVEELQKQQQQLERQIEQLTKTAADLAVARELDRVPGIGRITAVTAASRLAARTF